MVDKEFSQLTMAEKFKLQGLMKKQRSGQPLAAEEQQLYDRFSAEFGAAERKAKGRWPIIILLIVAACLQLAHQCQATG